MDNGEVMKFQDNTEEGFRSWEELDEMLAERHKIYEDHEQNCGCPNKEEKVVCASDGYTYINVCRFNCADGKSVKKDGTHLFVKYNGPCLIEKRKEEVKETEIEKEKEKGEEKNKSDSKKKRKYQHKSKSLYKITLSHRLTSI